MLDIDSIFSFLDEPTQNEASLQLPNIKKDRETLNESIASTSKKHHLQEELQNVDITKRLRQDQHNFELNVDLNPDILNSRVVVRTLQTNDGCTHEVAISHNQKYIPLEPRISKPAKQYKFELDPFQKQAILCIDNLQSVLVSAHTSAGKTAVAEYAIALSLEKRQRIIYTTPIKALSNQKYKEFSEEFKDVGLITGDVTINSSASCLIMTTEILRNMLYKGSEIIREVGWVIFDEIHYMRDKERGVVWEETLILLSDDVRYVFLSATIPNARQFAEWVCHLHSQPCHVIYTEYRPTPLQHYLYPVGGNGIHLLINKEGHFKEDNLNAAMSVLSNTGDRSNGDQRRRHGAPPSREQMQNDIHDIIMMMVTRSYEPIIIFSFSRKDCVNYAMHMTKMDFTKNEEKKQIKEIFNNALEHALSEEDRKLPQVENAFPLLFRGIGIHHGGLLPVLKEIVEILFACGLIKILFATETFAMGLNMPAKTVVFTNCEKFDGKDFRFITSGEYIQMSGRAGRRGLDDKGIVILMIDQKVTPTVVKGMVQGKADPLNSAFHLTYNMILHLMRLEEINPEYMMERSFFQFQNQASVPNLIEKVKAKQEEYGSSFVEQEQSVTSYCDIRSKLESLKSQLRSYITQPKYLKRYLTRGRLVKVKTEKYEYEWGPVVSFREVTAEDKKKNKDLLPAESDFIVDVLLNVKKISENDSETYVPCPLNEKGGTPEIISVLNTSICEISSMRVILEKDLRPEEYRKSARYTLKTILKKYPTELPLMDPTKRIKEPECRECMDSLKQVEERLHAHPIHADENRDSLLAAYDKKQALFEELMLAKARLKKAMSILHMEELGKRKRVLRRLGYCTPADVIELKGRIACELTSADELLLTELIFNGVFTPLTPGQSAALVSCFVCDESSTQNSDIAEELRPALRQLQEYARRIAKVSIESSLDLDEEEYVGKFKFTLMNVVLAWSKGASFLEICKITDIFEGSIIRCMRRLEETLRQLSQAAKTIGNPELENKFNEARKLLKRDVVFAASLYSFES